MCYAIAIYNTLQSNVIILKQTMICLLYTSHQISVIHIISVRYIFEFVNTDKLRIYHIILFIVHTVKEAGIYHFAVAGICRLIDISAPVSYTHLDVYKRQR